MLRSINYLFFVFIIFSFTNVSALQTKWSNGLESQVRIISPYTHTNNENQLYKIILPAIPSNLEFRQKRAKQVLSGEAHLIYDLNKKICYNQNYYQYTTESVEIPTDNEKITPTIILCKNPKEASHLLRNNVSKSPFHITMFLLVKVF